MVVERDDANGGVATPPKRQISQHPRSENICLELSLNRNRPEKVGNVHEELVKPISASGVSMTLNRGDLKRSKDRTVETLNK